MVWERQRETLGKKVVDALQKNWFAAEYVATKEEAKQRALEILSEYKTIGVGGSITVMQLGILNELQKQGKEVFSHNLPGLSPEERLEARRRQLLCDCFITSTNAVTLDGKLINVDGTGNRVAAMIFGPKKVLVVAGVNKITKDVEAALERIEMHAGPMNCMRLQLPTPCTQTGLCMDCNSERRICNVTTIMRKEPSQTDISIIIVGEELGY